MHSGSGSLNDWISHVSRQETCCKERSGVSQDALSYNIIDSKEIQYEIPNCSTTFSFAVGNFNYASDYTNGLNLNHLNGETEAQFKHMGVEIHSEFASNSMVTENSDIGLRSYGPAIEKSIGNLVIGGKYSCTSMLISLKDADVSSHDVNHTESSIYQIPDVVYETSEDYSAVQYCQCRWFTSFRFFKSICASLFWSSIYAKQWRNAYQHEGWKWGAFSWEYMLKQ